MMPSPDNIYDYEYYDLLLFFSGPPGGPPIIDKKNRLLAAVVQNQVGVVQDLLDSPKWYNVTDRGGLPLLHIAILRERHSQEVFDYMLSLPDFPIDVPNEHGQTALYVALNDNVLHRSNSGTVSCIEHYIWMSEHFAYELVKRGVSTDFSCFDGKTPLHCALVRSFDKVASLLIEKGLDVNVPDNVGFTPLSLAVDKDTDVGELVFTLLTYGAIPTVDEFRDSILQNGSSLIQEVLFLYIFDEHSDVELQLCLILKLAEKKSFLFHELLKHKFTVVSVNGFFFSYFSSLINMDIDYLRIIIEKFSDEIREAFANVVFDYSLILSSFQSVTCLENLELMLGSDLRSDVIWIICALDQHKAVSPHVVKSDVIEIYCYLLSYGLKISECQLLHVYSTYGHSELFKIFLHMDFNFVKIEKSIWPTLLYDVSLNIEHFFKHPDLYTWNSDTIKKLCKYFAHPRLIELYAECAGDSSEILELPQLPLLTELARNVFRKYFIESFQVRTSRRFYTLLNSLPISAVHKKIISCEIELYDTS